ncbi:MAG: Ribokinase [uncultured Chloroflexi bacterium]|uniref:Ribokinase n=1 Tax=uncultured Chloroflexota bacterium TaxID=166587 RepID=A0A6J4HIK1_9CHLR|nr:MAG: Ribokinase [uncultured Chloroflexota bacterium]
MDRSEWGERGGLSAMARPRVCVVGSANVDLVFSAPRQPLPGESVSGTAFGMFIGGKGANQAVAAARAGAHVDFVGRLGSDAFGNDVAGALEQEGISLKHVTRDTQEGTGVAGVVVEPDGTNAIIVVPRANGRLSDKDVQRARGAISAAGLLLLQLEVSLDATLAAARVARRAGVTVVLNPAPARELPDALLQLADVITPNETETRVLTGIDAGTPEGARAAAQALRQRGVGTVLLTLGDRGALLLPPDGNALEVPSFPVRVVDTTAAGDAFCGALGVAMAEGRPMEEAARFACAAGALACTVMGAGPSLPPRLEIERLLAPAP